MNEDNIPKPSKKFYILLLIFILSGSLNIILLKNIQKSKGPDFDEFAKHTWLTSFIMFIGEFSSMFIYLFIRNKLKRNRNNSVDIQEIPLNKNKKSRRPPIPTNFIFAISSMMDLIGTSITNLSLACLTASMNQMLKNTHFYLFALLVINFWDIKYIDIKF